ncbi:dipeptide/oligopeptide/nickel ABC transporter ATP-binding protein [Leminorella grimontii]|uniref:ABC transporter ATP-binding protein n=1 Tax=Leminorella grimontii TaxID=82981 RepID=UPI0032202B9D
MLLKVDGVEKSYPREGNRLFSRQRRSVIRSVSFTIEEGECVGLIGESGGGKSTLARLICGLEAPDSGQILLDERPVLFDKYRKNRISAVFQDYASSINPVMTVFQALSEPILLQERSGKGALAQRVSELLSLVGLPDSLCERYVHQLSGGQAQRVCIGRAIANNPRLLVLDEAISSLDVSSQVQILDLLAELRSRFNLSYLFITHDVQAVAYLCNRALFFREGKIVERCDVDEIASVSHPYARRLIGSVMAFP